MSSIPIKKHPLRFHEDDNFGNEVAVVLYWLTSKYNPDDEERMTVEEMGFSWERRAK